MTITTPRTGAATTDPSNSHRAASRRRRIVPTAGPRTRAERPSWSGTPHPAHQGAKSVVLTVAVLLVIIPLVSVVSTSLSDQQTLARSGGYVLFTTDPTLEAYRQIFSGGTITRALLVSLAVTAVGTTLSTVITVAAAYGLSRAGSLLGKPMLILMLLTLLFAPGMIPSYLMVKQLGLLDSYWSLILPVCVNAFNVIVMRSFFMDLPEEILDSARLDGANEVQLLVQIVLPLSKAVVAVIALFYGVGYWNSFFSAILYLQDQTKYPLQVILRQYAINGNAFSSADIQGMIPAPQQALQMAVLVVSIVPILIIYPFLQKHFTKGVLTGAVKG